MRPCGRARVRACPRVSACAHGRRLLTTQVKDEMPKEYETFLEVLTQFRSQRCVAPSRVPLRLSGCACARGHQNYWGGDDAEWRCMRLSVNAEMVVTVVAEMLVGRQHLLEGFSNFLPPACREILLERYTEGKDGCAPRRSDHSMQSAESLEQQMQAKLTPKGKTRSPKGTRVDHTHPLVADMPIEAKRKRDSTTEMLLRPPKALLNSYAGMGKRMSQQQARCTSCSHARMLLRWC